MKVYRGPKTADEINLTDEFSLKEKQVDLRPDENIWVDINVDKKSSKLSSACITFSEKDFELIHENYVEYLKETITKQKQALEVNEKGWESLFNYMQNLNFIDLKKNEIIDFVKELNEEKEKIFFSEIELKESKLFNVKSIDFKDALDINGLMELKDGAKHIIKIIEHSKLEFEDWASYICGPSYYFDRTNRKHAKRLISDLGAFTKLLEINDEKLVLCSDILIKLIKSMKKDVIVIM